MSVENDFPRHGQGNLQVLTGAAKAETAGAGDLVVGFNAVSHNAIAVVVINLGVEMP